MVKHVIALLGEGDSGKTQTLLKLINKLYEGDVTFKIEVESI